MWQHLAMSDLPPLELAQAYVVVGPNDQRGPYTMELLLTEVVEGRLAEATPVWWPGLDDWTTMGGHPAVAVEIQRRRGSAAPAWADPSTAPPPPGDPYAQPQQYAQPEQGYAQPQQYAEPQQYAPVPSDPAAQPAQGDPFVAPAPIGTSPDPVPSDPAAQPAQGDPFAPAPAEAEGLDVVDAEIVEAAATGGADPAQVEVFTLLVARSSARAQRQAQVDAVDESLVAAVSAAAADAGYHLAERNEVERRHELRFENDGGDLVAVSLGRPRALQPEDLRSDHVPLTVTHRRAVAGDGVVPSSGPAEPAHGDVVVAADEWTGQSTSSVALFLGLEDYLDEHLGIDGDAVRRDVAAAVAVVVARLD